MTLSSTVGAIINRSEERRWKPFQHVRHPRIRPEPKRPKITLAKGKQGREG